MSRRRYPVCIKKNPLTLANEALVIPDLDNIRIDLTDPEIQSEITRLGGHTRFLELFIDDVLETKDQHDEDIEEPNTLESYETNNYALYFLSSLEKINPKKIPGKAVLVVGEGTERSAYFVEKKRLVRSNNISTSVSVSLTAEDLAVLDPKDIDSKKPVKITRKNGSLLEPMIRDACTEANRPQPDPNDLWILIRVDHVSKNRSHFCEDALPSITTLTLCLEWLVMIPLAAGTLKTAERSFLPAMDNDVANYTTLGRSTFNSLMMLYMIMRGAGAENLDGLGRTIDGFFHSVKRKICFAKPATTTTENQNTANSSHKIMGFILKAGLTISMLHYIISMGEVDYEQNQFVKDGIGDKSAAFSAATYNVISAIWYGLNQLNDPTIYLGYLIGGINEINTYLKKRKIRLAEEMTIEDVSTSHTPSPQTDTLVDIERGRGNSINNAALHARLLEGMAPSDTNMLGNHSPRVFSSGPTTQPAPTPLQPKVKEEKSVCVIM